MVGHRGWLAVRDQALAGLARRPALVVILGEPGTGKTVLLRDLHRLLLESAIAARIVPPVVPPPALDDADPNAVLLVDDASRLSDDTLARLLADDRRLVVLADRIAFAERLAASPRPPLWLELTPLRPEEVAGFISASLPEAERETTIFSEQAATRLAERAAGVPRGLHSLAGMALLLANREQADAVEPRHVDQASLVGESGLHAALMAVSPPRPSPVSLIALAEPAEETAASSLPVATPDFEPDLADRERFVWRLLAIGSACLVVGAVAWQFLPADRPARPPAPPAVLQPQPDATPPVPDVTPPAPDVKPSAPDAAASAPPAAPAPPEPAPVPPASLPVSPTAPPASEVAPAAPASENLPPPPLATASEPDLALPKTALVAITVRFPAGNAHAAHQATMLVTGLRAAGFAVSEPAASTSRELSGIHYAYAEDRDAADHVAEAANHLVASLPLAATRRKPAERETSPIPGEVEIIVSGEGDSQ